MKNLKIMPNHINLLLNMPAKVIAYCVKCRSKREMSCPKRTRMKKTKMWALTGKCVKCGTKMYRIVGKAEPKDYPKK